ncbi:hypothetical protein [Brachybacterium sp. YJGR34]|uniref:hypothetical protein n=1 Tax=Brachybacterium sp. YJGR34 TaxID=2059911 RepID=UPI000E0C53F7|nr:hypothetical protein [Brachybacterium sp. YJGR34]
MRRPVPDRSGDGAARLPFVDWARGAAYVLMVIAHVAPSDGPARILLVSEFLTAPLFALLVGAGAQLARDRARETGRRFVLRELIRAVLVLGLGLLLARSQAQVLIVLVPLAVLMVLCLPLARLRTRHLALAAALAAGLAVLVPAAHAQLAGRTAPGDEELGLRVLGLVGGTGSYRLTGFLLCALLGMLAIRALRGAPPRRWPRVAACAGLSLAGMLALLVAPNLLGLYGVHAYDGTPSEQLGVALGALGVLLALWALLSSPPGRALPTGLVEALAAPGAMALTLYSLQVLVLHGYQVRHPFTRDDHWWMLALLLALGLVVPLAWRALAGLLPRRRPPVAARPATAAWSRGPLEGLIAGVQNALVPVPAPSSDLAATARGGGPADR